MTGERAEPYVHASRNKDCPLRLAHDRFDESHWFFHQMQEYYHQPTEFRFSLNAFLNALKSVVDMLRLDLERLGHNEWHKQRVKAFAADPMFRAFSRGRDVVVHQGTLVQHSQAEVGLFRGRTVKLAFRRDMKTGESSRSLLARLQQVVEEQGGGVFGRSGQRGIGEQLGVRRFYFVPDLSATDDVVTASHTVWMKVGDLLDDAHGLFRMTFDSHAERAGDEHDVGRIAVLLESDVDPTLLDAWDW